MFKTLSDAKNYDEIKVIRKIKENKLSTFYLAEYSGICITLQQIKVNKYEKDMIFKLFKRIIENNKNLEHNNIVEYVDCYMESDAIIVISEFCNRGDLHTLLRNGDINLKIKAKISILLGIAKGMKYLHSNKIIHKDLNSGNILLEFDNDTLTAKINEYITTQVFGSSSHQEVNLTSTIDSVYRTSIGEKLKEEMKGDIYSFGNLMWECFNRHAVERNSGYVAFKQGRPDMTKMDINTPDEVIEMMHKCWDSDYLKRPLFDDIVIVLDNLLQRINY
jgi:serine/threonine protein kinase